MVKVKLQRLFDTGEETIGRLYLNDIALCWTLEDTYRPAKIKHKTRISAGSYKLAFRKYGRWYEKLKARLPEINQARGMIEVTNVPNYSDILIHTGNTEDHTSGCILLGIGIREDDGGWHLVDSTTAYKKVYGILAGLMEDDVVILEVRDEKEIEIDLKALGIDEVAIDMLKYIKKGSD